MQKWKYNVDFMDNVIMDLWNYKVKEQFLKNPTNIRKV